MSIRVALAHRTRYRYARPVTLSPQLIRLRPAPHTRTPLHEYSLQVRPAGHFVNWLQDAHGNHVARVVYPEPTQELSISVDLICDLVTVNPFDFFVEPYAGTFPFEYPEPLRADLEPFMRRLAMTPRFTEFMGGIDRSQRNTVEFLVDVNRAVHRAVAYVVRLEHGFYQPEETLARGKGSCRDSAWLLVQVLRQLGFAARFVSGYLIQLALDERPTSGPTGPERDFTDLHAWSECFVPGAGWIGLDPTSGLLAAEGHIPLACTASPDAAAPVEGAAEQVAADFSFEMHVTRLERFPRPKRPYVEAEWQRILQLGDRVEEDLLRHDVRLTMGGEPTFVSSEAADAPEWNIAALGGEKRQLAERLLFRLYDDWCPGGLVHEGQGKWYPGEQLPRWALACYSRVDGCPVWQNPRLIAKPTDPARDASDAERFVRHLCNELAIAADGVTPAYEDVWYYLWRERRLPVNVDPFDSKLDDPLERDRFARLFERGLGEVVGFVLPLRHDGAAWLTACWRTRDARCLLLPGDSPMGYRLPLSALEWTPPEERDVVATPDPFAERPALPRHTTGTPATLLEQPSVDAQRRVVSTALCVEPRDGQLFVFVPPVPTLEAYLELIAAVERSAAALDMPVRVEGYPPPEDPRIAVLKLTPDPGVLEVNVPPVQTFRSLVDQTCTLYEAARVEGLVPDKFEIDGTHVSSGGGHHLVLGGASAADSPFLRRPELLASMLAYWHNHPALSYVFTGRFIGPTSQAPRVDEARDDSVHELELALRSLDGAAHGPPWRVDRALRHLLVDVTGNTHRAEICIDKLYSPDGPAGRLGLVELRGFEMSPHPHTSTVMQLLVRGLVAAFWREPYRAPLVRWGSVLHDRFLLPYFLERDLDDVLVDLRGWGYDFDASWFAPHREHRFPVLGEIASGGVSLEVRAALEPWLTLGEEATGSGQARYVDSSVERVQVVVRGLTPGRHRVGCNRWQLPLHPTGRGGEAVCGVRYRAWQPPSCLHPTIGVHGPLHFDIYDDWSGRAIAGCTYHVAHPGGLSHTVRPVNAAAAESRRIARFEAIGHTPGPYELRRPAPRPEFPLTLDLRWCTVTDGARGN